MRFYILLVIASAIALSVNASTTEKRELSVGCSNDIALITKNFVLATKMVNNALDYKPIRKAVKVLLSDHGAAIELYVLEKNCCKNSALNMNGEDSHAFAAILSPLVDDYVNLVSALVNKKAIVEKDETTLSSTKNLLLIFNTKSFVRSISCLTPAETALLDEKITKVNSEAKIAYGL